MSFVDFIGFIISFFAIIFLFFRNRYERKHPEENLDELEQAEQELTPNQPLKDFLKALEVEKEKREFSPASSSKRPQREQAVRKQRNSLGVRKIISPLESRKLISPLAKRHHKDDEEERRVIDPPIVTIYKQLNKPVNMVVYSEILNKPKGW